MAGLTNKALLIAGAVAFSLVVGLTVLAEYLHRGRPYGFMFSLLLWLAYIGVALVLLAAVRSTLIGLGLSSAAATAAMGLIAVAQYLISAGFGVQGFTELASIVLMCAGVALAVILGVVRLRSLTNGDRRL